MEGAVRRWAPWGVVAAGVVFVVALTVLVVVDWSPLQTLDRRLADAAHRQVTNSSALLALARAVSHVGDPLVVTSLSVVLAVGLWVARRRRAALAALVIRVAAMLTSSGVKAAVDRPRPHFAHAVAHASSAAFPSGHALGSAALWGTAALLLLPRAGRWPAVALAAVVPVLVGTARVLLGVHWPSDVVAGLCLGWLLAATGGALFRLALRSVP